MEKADQLLCCYKLDRIFREEYDFEYQENINNKEKKTHNNIKNVDVISTRSWIEINCKKCLYQKIKDRFIIKIENFFPIFRVDEL